MTDPATVESIHAAGMDVAREIAARRTAELGFAINKDPQADAHSILTWHFAGKIEASLRMIAQTLADLDAAASAEANIKTYGLVCDALYRLRFLETVLREYPDVKRDEVAA